ncbi:MAG: prepilin-type N-terminal cleavage/methylation domain-containing protein [Acidobacteria bacterium]|nr:prepilin-type N-terminal cleavage/methylation domain-containing protein [Acidobacteriota bacterium]
MKRGFTLLEVMAAVMILSIAMVVLIRAQTESLNAVLRVQNYERAVFITENQLHWTLLDLNEAEHWSEYAELSGDDGDYDWQVLIDEASMEMESDTHTVMLRIVAETSWPDGRGRSSYQLTTYYLWGEDE